ncbi:MAG: hypothetical protein J5831_05775 [Bacteroidales bacterium]|nr:hypothetical protein [Bacteroidales bacterium]
MKTMIVLAGLLSLFGCASPLHSSKPSENDTITYFSLSEGGGMNRFSGFAYSVEVTKEGKVHFLFNEGYPDEKELTIDDRSVFDSLQAIVMKHKIYKYDSHYRPIFDVLDGTSWHIYITYASGKSISTGGYMSGPDGYRAAISEFINCLDTWKALPAASNDVVSFLYEYGKDRYTLERKGDHAVMTIDNTETGEHQVLDRELDVLDDLRILFNIDRLKMNQTRGDLDFEYTPWMYEITYSNGDHYRYEGYDRDFKCGYTETLQYFISNCLKDKEERDHFNYY